MMTAGARFAITLLALAIAAVPACASPDPSSGATCTRAHGLPTAGATPVGCTMGRTVVLCAYAREVCTCVTGAPQCPGCSETSGFRCASLCTADEYAVSCDKAVPEGCAKFGLTQSGSEAACCPCGLSLR